MDFARGGELMVGLVGFEGARERLGVREYEDGVEDTDWNECNGQASCHARTGSNAVWNIARLARRHRE